MKTNKLMKTLKLTVSLSPGVVYHNHTIYPGIQSIDVKAVNHPNKCAHKGNS